MADEYIDLNNIKQKPTLQPIYQYQLDPDSDKLILTHVGDFVEKHDVTLNKFDLLPDITCFLISTLYTATELTPTKHSGYNLFKILIKRKDKDKNKDKDKVVGSMQLNFTNPESPIYTISFHYSDKRMILHTTTECTDLTTLVDKMIQFMVYEEVIEKLK